MRHFRLFCLFAFLFLNAVSMGRAERPMMLQVHPEPLIAETAEGERHFTIEIADDGHEHARGLMFRQNMDDDRGMLFVFPHSQRRGFWMKNTPMPLDLIFIGEDGKVRAIEKGEPFSTQSIEPQVNAQFVLELKAGIAQENSIVIGTQLRHPAIDAVSHSQSFSSDVK